MSTSPDPRFAAFAASPLLRTFSPDEVAEIYAIGRDRDLATGETLFHRGDPGDSMYVVLEGQVGLVFPTEIAGKSLGPGDFFGELSLVSPEHVRTGSALAEADTVLREFDQEAFDTLLDQKPKLLVSLLKWISSYLLSSEQRLTEGLQSKNLELERTLDYLQRAREELDQQEILARTDELTGLFNRRAMNVEIENYLRHSEYRGGDLGLVLIDLDEFKLINDTHGHPVGDAVLKAVAGVIRSSVRRIDLPCRIGGDEFAVVFPQVERKLAETRAEQIRRRIAEQPFDLRGVGKRVRVSVSLGGALHTPGETAAALLERADQALYISKRAGRNQLHWADPAGTEVASSSSQGG